MACREGVFRRPSSNRVLRRAVRSALWGALTFLFVPAAPVAANDCTQPVVLQPGFYAGNSKGQRNDFNNYSCVAWNETGEDVVYELTTTATGTITARLTNRATSLINVFILDTCSPARCLAYGTSTATVENAPPGTYYLVVDGANGAYGTYDLTVTMPGTCVNPVRPVTGVVHHGATYLGPIGMNGYRCAPTAPEGGPEAVHRFSKTHTGPLRAELSEMSTNLDVFIVEGCSATGCRAAGDTVVSLATAPPGDYDIVVDGEAAGGGSYSLLISQPGSCTDPIELAAGTPFSGHNAGGTSAWNVYGCNAWGESGPEVVHHLYSNRIRGDISASLSNLSSDLDVMILDTGCDPQIDCLDEGNDMATATDVPPGDYYVVVDGYGSAVATDGPYTLTVDTACRTATTLAPGIPFSGTTMGGMSSVSQYGCTTWNESGPEALHAFNAPYSGRVLASLSNTTTTLDVFFVEGCTAAVCRAVGIGSAELDVTAGTAYEVVVEGYQGASGDYTLTLDYVIPQAERAALLDLYASTAGSGWTNRSGWTDPRGTECGWYGVTCDANGTHVTGLSLRNNNLVGTLPSTLGNLSSLTFADLGGNTLSGGLPASLGSLGGLTALWLDANRLGGTIPPELVQLSNLTILDLDSNQFAGSVPPELGQLLNLQQLFLGNNGLTGTIPTTLAGLANLSVLELYGNALGGTIPPDLGQLSNLTILDLDSNQLTGSVPPELGQLSLLSELYLGANRLSGPIPSTLTDLPNLAYLEMYGNDLSGPLPTNLEQLSALVEVHLAGNRLSGPIPAVLALDADLAYLNLEDNELSGTIPPELGTLPALQFLALGRNRLTGPIPDALGNLTGLAVLMLDANALEGAVPASLTNLSGLGTLTLRYNALYALTPPVQAFLDARDPGWDQTQTVAPAGIVASALSADGIRLDWTPIPYTADAGRYEVCYGTYAAGPYPVCRSTADKGAAGLDVEALFAATTYYVTVRTVTDPHPGNRNTVVSGWSAEISAATAADVYTYERMWPAAENIGGARELRSVSTDKKGRVLTYDVARKTLYEKTSRRRVVTTRGGPGVRPGEFLSDVRAEYGPDGAVYVADTGNNRVQVFRPDGTVATWSGDGFSSPADIAVWDRVYLADTGNDRVVVLDADGTVSGVLGRGAGGVFVAAPVSVALDAGGGVLVGEQSGRVRLLDARDGNAIRSWMLPDTPSALETDRNGVVLALAGAQVYRLDAGGEASPIGLPSGSGEGRLSKPTDIASDRTGSVVYVADGTLVHRFLYSERPFVFEWPPIFLGAFVVGPAAEGHFQGPAALAIDAAGRFLVADRDNHRIQVFRPEADGAGGTDHVFDGAVGGRGALPGLFESPEGVAVSDDRLYVADTGNHRIQAFRRQADGSYLHEDTWGGPGSATGLLNGPKGLYVDGFGRLIIVDSGNGRLQRLDTQTGVFEVVGGGGIVLSHPTAVAGDGAGFFYVSDTGNGRLVRYDGAWGNPTVLDTGAVLRAPSGVAVEADGTILASDVLRHRILRFDPTGVLLSGFGEQGDLPGQFQHPAALARFADGSLLVADSGQGRIQKFAYHPAAAPPGAGMYMAMAAALTGERSKAIIVAGGGPSDNPLWNATAANANFAYWTLTQQGFDKGSIFYLSDDPVDLDGNGLMDDVDAPVTGANLEYAILDWGADADHLVLYATDHGGTDVFRLNPTEVLTAAELGQWLDLRQGTPPAPAGRAVVVYDACQAGSFLATLATGAFDRIVITSAAAGENAYWFAGGALSFSNFLWMGILDGKTLGSAFVAARDALGQVTNTGSSSLQNPQLVQTGIGTPATNVLIGNGTAALDHPTTFASVAMTAGSLRADVSDDDGVAQVWAVVMPPGFMAAAATPAPDDAVRELASFDLVPRGGGVYSRSYDGFDGNGAYRFMVYGEDGEGRIANAATPLVVSFSDGSVRRHKAVLFAAETPGDAVLEAASNRELERAYAALAFQGLSDADIHVIYPPGGSPPVFPGGSPAVHSYNPGTLSTDMAVWLGPNTADLVIFLFGGADPGGDFELGPGVLVSPASLAGAVAALQAGPGSDTVAIVYDAPHAGALLPSLSRTPGKDLIAVTSTGASQGMPLVTDGAPADPSFATFSGYFWRELFMGETFQDAWQRAAASVSAMGAFQTPLLDDGKAGQAARYFRLGRASALAASRPSAASVSPDAVLPAGVTASTVWVDGVTATGDTAALKVWATVFPPDYVPSMGLVDTGLDRVMLASTTPGRFEGSYGPFTLPGTYRFVFTLEDGAGRLSEPLETRLCYRNCRDAYEDDNIVADAKNIVINAPDPQVHGFHDPGDGSSDEDWVRICAAAGTLYEVTVEPDPGVNVALDLVDRDGSSLLAAQDTGGAGYPETLVWPAATPPAEGTYFLRVRQGAGSAFGGPDTGYRLRITDGSGGSFTLLYGYVRSPGGTPIAGVRVQSEAEPGFYTFTNELGLYNFSVSSGLGTRLVVTLAPGYLDGTSGSITPTGAAMAGPEVRLTALNTPPVALTNSYTLNEDQLLVQPSPGVLDNDSDADGPPIYAVLDSPTTPGALTFNDDGSFTYSPPANYNGSDSFLYHATDGTDASGVVTVSISVNPVNDPPVALPQAIAVDEYAEFTGFLTATDVDGPSLYYSIVTPGGQGTATVTNAATGAFRYVPNVDTTGSDSFVFRASDGALSADATVSVTIRQRLRVTLEAGLNLFGYPVTVPPGYAASDLLAALGAQSIETYNGSSFITYPPSNFAISQGEGYQVRMAARNAVMFDGAEACPASYDPPAGLRLIAVPCAPAGYTAGDLANKFGGNAYVSSVQRLNPDTGLLETLSWNGSAWVGPNFPVLPGEAWFVRFHTDPPPVSWP